MATKGDYFPVDFEDRSNSRLLKDSSVALPEDTRRSKINIINTESSQKCMSMWTFSLIVIGISVMFLVGVCVGFYVRDLQKDDTSVEEICGAQKKTQGTDYDKLGNYHETLVYYIRGEEVRKFVSEHGRDDPLTGSAAEKRLADAVLETFNSYRIDYVDVEEHEVMVTHADPDQPNLLDLLDSSGRKLQHMVLINHADGADNSSRVKKTSYQRWRHPHVVFSPAGKVQADLVYGHYGRDTDFLLLQALGVEVKNKLMLLRLGKLSLADKILNCETHGVRGVILYWEPQDAKDDVNSPEDSSYIPFASAATYSTESTFWRPSIPCQTISSDQAKVLMSLLILANNSIPAPVSWQGSLASSYVIGGQKSGSLVAHLSVFNKIYMQRIQNIISTIQGTEEPDRYVIVGAPRSSLPGQSQDVVASTSILTQLAHSFNYVHRLHYWKPKRSIKLISWGGAEFSNCGILHYIKTYHHLLDRRAVAYFDISQLALGNGSIVANIPPGLHQLIYETTVDVSDPKNPDQTLEMTWKQSIDNNSSFSQQRIITMQSYHSDKTSNPFLHVLGVPEVKLQYRAPPGSHNSVSAMTSADPNNHYKFHTTVTHMLVKSMLVMLDNELLPLNLQNEARSLQEIVEQTVDVLEQCFPNVEDFYPALAICKDLVMAAGGIREISNLFVKRSDKQGMRIINDIIMTFGRLFLVHNKGGSQHILYPTLDDSSLTKAAELCEVGEVTQLGNVTREFEETLNRVLKMALTLFRFSA